MLFLNIPKEIDIKIGNNWIKIKGPLGSVIKKKPQDIKFYFDKKSFKLYLLNKNEKYKHYYLLLVNKLIWGLYKGFTIKLNLIGIGYKVSIESNKLILKLGYSHDIIYTIPAGIEVSVLPKQKNITLLIFGNNHQKVNQVAAEIRNLKKPEPYKGKGIRYFDEKVTQKQGKRN
jgi:large subunit ribosomal protein L6